ncbi:MAG: glutaminase A [Firmicutes bacterium]|nr:glutaminase A [Bacillota bacterium]
MQQLIDEILKDCRRFTEDGKVADYIPELAKANKSEIGICVTTGEKRYFAGDWNKPFTIQSIAKTIFLMLAVEDNGIDFIKAHVGVEATGKPFNAIDYAEPLLLRENINPMVNIGAIAVCSLVKAENYQQRFLRLLDFTKRITGNPDLKVDENVYYSEKKTGDKNRALAYLLKNSGMIEGRVEDLLDVYFAMCSVQATCADLANMALLLANHGMDIATGQQIISEKNATFMNAVLITSGMYDGSGEFATTVGLPAKSGVGGGIMANRPGHMGIGIYSPGLDKKGNSVAGIKMLEMLSQKLRLSIF